MKYLKKNWEKQNEIKIEEKVGLEQKVFESLKVMFGIALSQINLDFFKNFLCVYYFAMLGVCHCAGLPLVAASGGYTLVALL